jgi:hypothetical protein
MERPRRSAERVLTSPWIEGVEGSAGLLANRRSSLTELMATWPFVSGRAPFGIVNVIERWPVTQPA